MTRIPLRIQLEGYAIYEEERSFKFYPFWDREIIGVKPDAPQWAKDEYEELAEWKKEQDEILRISYRDMLEREECTIENGLKVLKPNASQKAKEKYEEYLEERRLEKIEYDKMLDKLFSEPTELELQLLELEKFEDIVIEGLDYVLKPNASQEARDAMEKYREWEKKHEEKVKQSDIKINLEPVIEPPVKKNHEHVFAPLFKLFKKIFP